MRLKIGEIKIDKDGFVGYPGYGDGGGSSSGSGGGVVAEDPVPVAAQAVVEAEVGW